MRTIKSNMILCGLMLSLIWSCSLGQIRPWATSSLTIKVVDSQGRDIGYDLESFRALGDGEPELKSNLAGDKIDGLELGKKYVCVARAKASRHQKSITITLNNRNSILVLVLQPAASVTYAVPPVSKFVTKIPMSNDAATTWVVVRPAFQTEQDPALRTETSVVDSTGRFELQGPHQGPVLMTFHRGSTLIGACIVSTVDSPREIELTVTPVIVQ